MLSNCFLLASQVVGGDSGPVVCGAGTDFLVQPHDRGTEVAPRRLSAPEALSATITGRFVCLVQICRNRPVQSHKQRAAVGGMNTAALHAPFHAALLK